jgi:XTP/dITP diphosphohydrolase
VPKPLLIGSGNRGKAAELAELLRDLDWEVKSLADFPKVDEPIEDADTFEGNALKKAAYYSELFGIACIADDSGLVVDALNGAPGIYSARYAGPECDDARNREKLLAALKGIPTESRTARFVCCAVFIEPGSEPHLEKGAVEGHIAFKCKGVLGFGYDPLFIPEGFDATFGEIDPAQKHSVSHRGRALRKLCAYLESLRENRGANA